MSIKWQRAKRGAFVWESSTTGVVYVMAPSPGKRWLLLVDGIAHPKVFRTQDDAAMAALSEDVVAEAIQITEVAA